MPIKSQTTFVNDTYYSDLDSEIALRQKLFDDRNDTMSSKDDGLSINDAFDNASKDVANNMHGLAAFLTTIRHLGYAVANNFNVTIMGRGEYTFFASSVSLPSMKFNTTQIYYDGRAIDVPVDYDWDHDLTITFNSDASLTMYRDFLQLIKEQEASLSLGSGVTIVVTMVANDTSKGYGDIKFIAHHARLESVGTLEYSHDASDVMTYDASFKVAYFEIV